MFKQNNSIDYDRLVDQAMRGVVYKILCEVVRSGLPGEHHFYISFLTTAMNVKISRYLLHKYPEEMTIVLQHRYEDLEVNNDFFSVLLSFGGIPEKLIIPFSAVTVFFDPSTQFGLKFKHYDAFRVIKDDPQVTAVGSTKLDQADASKIIKLNDFKRPQKPK